jgi:formylglycine-generating enzyme required for sulfatase activity
MLKNNFWHFSGLSLLVMGLAFTACGFGRSVPTVDMVFIPAGEFIMGGDAEQAMAFCEEYREPYNIAECKRSWFDKIEPIHSVYLDDYYIDRFEITNADYQVCVEDGVCSPPENNSSKTREEYYGNPEYGDYPVQRVNWNQAVTYCEWRGARLPTEAEWEKAARGTEGFLYPWGNEFDGLLENVCGLEGEHLGGLSDTTPVGSYPDGASPYGVMDMTGNAIEWVADRYGTDYYQESPYENPTGPIVGSERVLRGTNFDCLYAHSNLIFMRGGQLPDRAFPYNGFRCASSSAPE